MFNSIVKDKTEVVIRQSELSQLLEEIRLLRRDLERSVEKQNELQLRLDENIRQSRSPREFTFSGRGVSYPDLRLIDASGLVNADNLSASTIIHETRSKHLASSTSEYEHIEYPVETERTSKLNNF